MQNYFSGVENDDISQESSSFCSSCESILRSIYSVGEVSFLDEFNSESIDEINMQTWIKESENVLETTNSFSKKAEEYKSNNKSDFIKEETIGYTKPLENPDSTGSFNAGNILNLRKRICETAQSVLQLSNYIDDIRTTIVQKIRKEEFIPKRPRTIYEILSDNNNGIKLLTSQALPIYSYNSLYGTKKKNNLN